MIEGLSLVPPDAPPAGLGLILLAAYLGAAITAAFSVGGGLLLIAVMASVLPAPAVVPVHGALMIGSNLGRTSILFRHIDRWAVGWFATGAGIGALVGAQVVLSLPAQILRLLIAAFILYSQWGPALRLTLSRRNIAVAGGISTFLTLFVGASGPFVTALLAQVERYSRQMLVATAGACMTLQHSLKVLVFGLGGFVYAPWLGLIFAGVAAGMLGAATGAVFLRRLPEKGFRLVLKWGLTALALHLLIGAALGVL